MENKVLDELMRTTKPINPPKPEFEGYIWVNILIKYSQDGNAEIVRSFTKPAEMSRIKHLVKPKTPKAKPITVDEAKEETALF